MRLSLATVSVMLLLFLSDPRQSNPKVTALLPAVLFTTFVLEAAALKKQEKVNFIYHNLFLILLLSPYPVGGKEVRSLMSGLKRLFKCNDPLVSPLFSYLIVRG